MKDLMYTLWMILRIALASISFLIALFSILAWYNQPSRIEFIGTFLICVISAIYLITLDWEK